jgi:hypothetical protein
MDIVVVYRIGEIKLVIIMAVHGGPGVLGGNVCIPPLEKRLYIVHSAKIRVSMVGMGE